MSLTASIEVQYQRLSRREAMLSLPLTKSKRAALPRSAETARGALERLLLPAVRSGRCYVLFSGGRDSSAILAVTTQIARRAGHPDPIPVTGVHPGIEESDESQWQQLVLEHLQIRDRIVLEFHGDQRLLGDVATGALRRHGLVWPESVQVHGAFYRHLDDGYLVTGEGGDQLISARRITPLRNLSRRRDRPSRADVAVAVQALLPRRRSASGSVVPAWLRGNARAEFAQAVSEMFNEPLRWDRATWLAGSRGADRILGHNLEAAMREYGLEPCNPLLHRDFAAALARQGGRGGYAGRTHLMRELFADVLPDEVLSRRTKAAFNQSRWGDEERDFARSWSGEGVDPDIVDAEALRAAWLAPQHHPGADFLLHVAWLASQNLDWTGSPR